MGLGANPLGGMLMGLGARGACCACGKKAGGGMGGGLFCCGGIMLAMGRGGMATFGPCLLGGVI